MKEEEQTLIFVKVVQRYIVSMHHGTVDYGTPGVRLRDVF